MALLADRLRTFSEYAAFQVSRVTSPDKRLLITGGGAFNKFLIKRISALTGCEIVIPTGSSSNIKSPYFRPLGALYMADQPSCLSSVTGASRDNIGGMLFKI